MRRPSASVLRTSEVLPPRWCRTSPGRSAVPLGRFSDDGIAAITFTRGFSSAMARRAARTAAAPPMSAFIHSMPLASLIESPPESNVMPLPVSAMGGSAFLPPAYVISMSRGGFSLPCPTPRTPPNPPFSRSDLLQIFTSRPVSLAILVASLARKSGVASPAGVFTRSRAQATLSERISARRIASRTSRASHRPTPTIVTVSSAARSGVASPFRLLYRSNRYDPSSRPSMVAWTASPAFPAAWGSVVATETNRDAVRATFPMARRSVSDVAPLRWPRPTRRTVRAGSLPNVGTVSVSPSRPRRLFSRYVATRSASRAFPVSATPGPASGPSNTGRINSSADASAGEAELNSNFGIPDSPCVAVPWRRTAVYRALWIARLALRTGWYASRRDGGLEPARPRALRPGRSRDPRRVRDRAPVVPADLPGTRSASGTHRRPRVRRPVPGRGRRGRDPGRPRPQAPQAMGRGPGPGRRRGHGLQRLDRARGHPRHRRPPTNARRRGLGARLPAAAEHGEREQERRTEAGEAGAGRGVPQREVQMQPVVEERVLQRAPALELGFDAPVVDEKAEGPRDEGPGPDAREGAVLVE